MFRVHDGRKKRKSMVTKYAAKDPYVGVLLAAADFEWTCRRAIQAMGTGSTKGIRYELFEQQAFGLRLNKGWEKQVKQKSKGITKFEDIFSVWAKKNCLAYVIWADIEYAMMWRNKLIHGIESDIGDSDGRKCVNILECACDILDQYLTHLNVNIYAYVGRGGNLSSLAKKVKKERDEWKISNMRARRTAKDEREISGVRMLRTSIQGELGISAKKLELAATQISRKFGIHLLV